MNRHRPSRRGFSLIEILIVITVMAVLLALVSSVSTSSLRSARVSEAARGLADEFAHASMEAVRTNRPVHFRLYRFTDADLGHTVPTVRAYQLLVLDTATQSYRPIGPLHRLGESIQVHDHPEGSTLLGLTEKTPDFNGADPSSLTDPELSGLGDYTYYSFEFRPDGSTNLPKDGTWGLVVAWVPNPASPASSDIPKNYRALTINPFTGAVRRY